MQQPLKEGYRRAISYLPWLLPVRSSLYWYLKYNTLKITPEWHITDRLTFKDTYSNYNNGQKEKNELTIVYTPALKKYAESLKFELSVAQSYYASGKQSSAVSFATGFKM